MIQALLGTRQVRLGQLHLLPIPRGLAASCEELNSPALFVPLTRVPWKVESRVGAEWRSWRECVKNLLPQKFFAKRRFTIK